MFKLDYNSRTPIYEQIKTELISMISSGILKPGDKLPSIRTLSGELGINFNTVKKVFASLEEDGVIYTVVGSGCFVADGAVRRPQIVDRGIAELSGAANFAKASGVTLEEALAAVREIYKESESE